MLVRIFWHEIRAAEIAEVCLALEADHMVTAHGLLSRCIARWTWRAESLEILQRCGFFFIELGLSSRIARRQLTVPDFLAHRAEGVLTILTDTKSLRHGNVLRLVFLLGICSLGLGVIFGLLNIVKRVIVLGMLFGTSSTLAPLTRAVYGVLVRFEPFLSLQSHIPLDKFVLDRDLQKFAWIEGPVDLPLPTR